MADSAGLDFDGLDCQIENPLIPIDTDLDQQGRARVRSRGGRPTKHTAPRVTTIIGALFDGASRAEAARRGDVGASTFYVWLALGRQGHPAFVPLADTVEIVDGSRGLNMAFGDAIQRRSFWR